MCTEPFLQASRCREIHYKGLVIHHEDIIELEFQMDSKKLSSKKGSFVLPAKSFRSDLLIQQNLIEADNRVILYLLFALIVPPKHLCTSYLAIFSRTVHFIGRGHVMPHFNTHFLC